MAAAISGVAFVALAADARAENDNVNEGVCQPQAGHLSPPNSTTKSITVEAPEGKLISGYCVKAGSIKQGNGPEYVTVDPPAASVTITHSSGKDISHYVVFYINKPVDPPVTVPEDPDPDPTTTTTVPDPDPTTTTTVPETELIPPLVIERSAPVAPEAAAVAPSYTG